MDANLFNGEYYEHQVRPPTDARPSRRACVVGMGAKNLADPDFQLGAGCLVDQLVGQYMAHVCGLGYLLDPEQVRDDAAEHHAVQLPDELLRPFQLICARSSLDDESALLMATYPPGGGRSGRSPTTTR